MSELDKELSEAELAIRSFLSHDEEVQVDQCTQEERRVYQDPNQPYQPDDNRVYDEVRVDESPPQEFIIPAVDDEHLQDGRVLNTVTFRPSSEEQVVRQTDEQRQPAVTGQSIPQLRMQAFDIMAKYLFDEAQKMGLLFPEQVRVQQINGVALRVARNSYTVWPTQQPSAIEWTRGLAKLNVGASLTLRSSVTEDLIQLFPPDIHRISLGQTERIQVFDSLEQLSLARKAQGAAFVRASSCVVVWCDNANELLIEAERMHKRIVQFLWNVVNDNFTIGADDTNTSVGHGYHHPIAHSVAHSSIFHSPRQESIPSLPSRHLSESFNKSDQSASTPSMEEKQDGIYDQIEGGELEYGVIEQEYRPTMIIAPLSHGLAFGISLFLCLLQSRSAMLGCLLDGNWIRMGVLGAAPFLFCITMFFCDNICTVVVMLLGPVRQLAINSRYYSGVKPKDVHPIELQSLPRITVHMPVYKETLHGVLRPSFESIKKAIRVYELQGGTASIIVSEDGMVLVDEEERQARLAYYEENNITWIGRPRHGDQDFLRAGRFKKASNLNFTYEVFERTEEQMRVHHPDLQRKVELDECDLMEKAQHKMAYNEQLQDTLATIHPSACGSGVDRMGDLILLVDSDTRIPEDGFLDAAIEMTRSKELGILQHCSGVMLVSESIFEKCIGYFTQMVNFSISYAVANGDMAPFMGHNAFLRWSAMKEIAHVERQGETPTEAATVEGETGEAGRITSFKIWSEEHVSEDFVMSLDLIDKGYITRWATYANGAYEEGVSLTCSDELNRWQKYAWGVSEILFNKFHQWFTRGPFSKLLRRFLFGKAPWHYRFSVLSYCCSYYAIASAVPTVIAVTLVDAWIGPDSLVAYLSPFQVWVSVVVVFCASSILAHFVRFRAGYDTLASLAWKQVKFLPFTTFFFGGLSYHCSTALLSHMCNVNMTWGATVKDYESVSFYKEVPSLLKRHWRMFLLSFVVMGGTAVCMSDLLPFEWRIAGLYQVFPLFFLYGCHVAYPILLNSNLIRFSF